MLNQSPIRIQRQRVKGWRMPPNTFYVGRPSKYMNPFYIGGYFMMGDPDPTNAGAFRMVWNNAAPEFADERYTLIETKQQAVEWFERLTEIMPFHNIEELRGKNLSCWCKLNEPCHADVLLRLANR